MNQAVNKRKKALGNASITSKLTKRTVSVRLQEATLIAIKSRMEEEGYSPRKRSVWITEAIIELYELFKVEQTEDWRFYFEANKVQSPRSIKPTKLTLGGLAAIKTFDAMVEVYDTFSTGENAISQIVDLAVNTRLTRAPIKSRLS
jgi:hypothetical protein